ncbi:MAG: hypothetical protein EB127_27965, partial [Alphaproteobacteria bacterium]|nr:hypothetical protein [Alphaproteobacteria bacterium]
SVILECKDFSDDEVLLLTQSLKAIEPSDFSEDELKAVNPKSLVTEYYPEVFKQLSTCGRIDHPSANSKEALRQLVAGPLRPLGDKFPLYISSSEDYFFLSKIVELYLGEPQVLNYRLTDPVRLSSARHVKTLAGLESFMDDLLDQQDSLTLSFIYGTSESDVSKIQVTTKSHRINDRLADSVFEINRSLIFKEKKSKDGTVTSLSIEKKELKKLFNSIAQAFKKSKDIDEHLLNLARTRRPY